MSCVISVVETTLMPPYHLLTIFALSRRSLKCWIYASFIVNFLYGQYKQNPFGEVENTTSYTANIVATKRDKWQDKKWLTEKAGGPFKE